MFQYMPIYACVILFLNVSQMVQIYNYKLKYQGSRCNFYRWQIFMRARNKQTDRPLNQKISKQIG